MKFLRDLAMVLLLHPHLERPVQKLMLSRRRLQLMLEVEEN